MSEGIENTKIETSEKKISSIGKKLGILFEKISNNISFILNKKESCGIGICPECKKNKPLFLIVVDGDEGERCKECEKKWIKEDKEFSKQLHGF